MVKNVSRRKGVYLGDRNNFKLHTCAWSIPVIPWFSVSFPLVGSPQRLAGARILQTCSGSKERFWTDPRQSEDKSQNDRNNELLYDSQRIFLPISIYSFPLWQRGMKGDLKSKWLLPKFINLPFTPLFQRGEFGGD